MQFGFVQEPEHSGCRPEREEDTVAWPFLPGALVMIAELAETAVIDDEPLALRRQDNAPAPGASIGQGSQHGIDAFNRQDKFARIAE